MPSHIRTRQLLQKIQHNHFQEKYIKFRDSAVLETVNKNVINRKLLLFTNIWSPRIATHNINLQAW